MPHISRRKISKEVFLKIHERFVKALVVAGKPDTATLFLRGVLTRTERIMIGKRILAYYFLAEGISTYRIEQMLDLSSSTVARFSHRMEKKKCGEFAFLFQKQIRREAFWKEIETIVRCGLPPQGKDRWDWLSKI